MSLTVALSYAVSGLNATQSQLQVLAGNIANAQTPGYSEEILPQTSDSATNGGAGVVTGEIQRVTDSSLAQTMLGQTTLSGAAGATDTYQQQIQDLVGQVGSGTTLADSLNRFASAMQAVATTPQDPSAQAGAVNAGTQLAAKLNGLSSGVQSLRQSADAQIATDVTSVNTALTQIGQLNAQISKLQALNQPTATLEDQRDQQLAQVAQFMGVASYTRADGTLVVLTTTGKTLVDGANARQFSYTQSGTVTAATALSPLTLNGLDVTAETNSGEIGALLTMRDTTLPGMTAQLNQVTKNLFNLTSDANLQTTNSGLGATNDQNHFFAAVDTGAGVDNAATVEVNPTLAANSALLGTGASGPDPTISATLAGNLSTAAAFAASGGLPATTTTLTNYAAQVIGSSATAAAAAKSGADDQSALLTQMQGQYSSTVGVNIDTELSKLVVYQNAYSASARVISTIQSMFQALMSA